MSQEDEIKNLLRIRYRRLQILEEKRAKFGELHTPVHILIELEDEKSEIENLEEKLSHLLSATKVDGFAKKIFYKCVKKYLTYKIKNKRDFY